MMDVEKARKLASKAYKEYLYAGSSQNIFIEDYISTCILTACREARLEEAEWWHNTWKGSEFSRHKCDPDNSICQRLAALKGAK